MNENDIQYLEKALINEKNEDIINQTFQEIDKNKENILNELELSKIDTKNLLKKLDDYKYIDEYPDLQIWKIIFIHGYYYIEIDPDIILLSLTEWSLYSTM